MNRRELLLRAARFQSPERIPLFFGIETSCWNVYPKNALLDLMSSHPLLFPEFDPIAFTPPAHAPWRVSGKEYRDSWKCLWETQVDGVTGHVVKHALGDWDELERFQPPDPAKHDGWREISWEKRRDSLRRQRTHGGLIQSSLRHGHTFLTLTYLRGYENALYDMADRHPLLPKLLSMIQEFNLSLVSMSLDEGVEWMGYPEDLGMQKGPLLSPAHFREFIFPIYRELMRPAREAGCVVHMHSDGDIKELAEDLLRAGVDVLNLQDLVNGLDWIEQHLKGRICIDLDLDRQSILPRGTPMEIQAHVREAVRKLWRPEGGLILRHGLHPGPPLENIEALMDAMERYAEGVDHG